MDMVFFVNIIFAKIFTVLIVWGSLCHCQSILKTFGASELKHFYCPYSMGFLVSLPVNIENI